MGKRYSLYMVVCCMAEPPQALHNPHLYASLTFLTDQALINHNIFTHCQHTVWMHHKLGIYLANLRVARKAGEAGDFPNVLNSNTRALISGDNSPVHYIDLRLSKLTTELRNEIIQNPKYGYIHNIKPMSVCNSIKGRCATLPGSQVRWWEIILRGASYYCFSFLLGTRENCLIS